LQANPARTRIGLARRGTLNLPAAPIEPVKHGQEPRKGGEGQREEPA
jgi:hypothetical protein